MGLAAKIIQPEPEVQFRHLIHDEADKWVDQIVAEAFNPDCAVDIVFSGPALSLDRAKEHRFIEAGTGLLSKVLENM